MASRSTTKRTFRALPILCLCAAALPLVGCATGRQGATANGAQRPAAVQHPMLAGVPVPRGFTVVDDRTLAIESGRFRVARYEFLGSASRNTVHDFYLENMPAAGFKLLKRQEENGVVTLRFQSATEECGARIGARGFKTFVVIDVTPLPQGAPPRVADPGAQR